MLEVTPTKSVDSQFGIIVLHRDKFHRLIHQGRLTEAKEFLSQKFKPFTDSMNADNRERFGPTFTPVSNLLVILQDQLTDCFLSKGDLSAAAANHEEVEALFQSLKA